MKISARNKIEGKVIEVTKGAVMAKVLIDIGNGKTINSVITVDSVTDLDLKSGDDVFAVIKSTEVMIAKCEKNN
jgi:molybdopterin-binding protein